jgi:cation diffusion facilitator CzcD-associated flavoprotein CzcO
MRDSVIIVGGGPAGLMAANVLEKHHIPYLILEKNKSNNLSKKHLFFVFCV